MTDAWDRFFFEEVPASTATTLRIAYGLLLTAWTISIGPDVRTFFTSAGFVPEHPPTTSGGEWGLLEYLPDDMALMLWAVLLISALAITLGVVPRVGSVIALVTLIAFSERNPWVDNSGDLFIRNLAFYVMLLPGAAGMTAMQFFRDRDRFWRFPSHPVWPLRLIQIQLSVGYLFSVWEKARGETWFHGTAVGYAVRLGDLARFSPPEVFAQNLVLVNLLTYGTLVAELALAILVWNRRLRPWVLVVGALLHLSIHVTLEVGFFSYAILVAYIAFIPPDRLAASLRGIRDRRVATAGQ